MLGRWVVIAMCIIHYICSKATETAQQLKKTAGVPFHSKGRGLVKKIDTTSKIYLYGQILLLSWQ